MTMRIATKHAFQLRVIFLVLPLKYVGSCYWYRFQLNKAYYTGAQ